MQNILSAFETLEEFTAVTSALTIDVWTGAFPASAEGVWEYKGVVVSNITEMWDPYPPPDGTFALQGAVFSVTIGKLFVASTSSSHSALCEKYS